MYQGKSRTSFIHKKDKTNIKLSSFLPCCLPEG